MDGADRRRTWRLSVARGAAAASALLAALLTPLPWIAIDDACFVAPCKPDAPEVRNGLAASGQVVAPVAVAAAGVMLLVRRTWMLRGSGVGLVVAAAFAGLYPSFPERGWPLPLFSDPSLLPAAWASLALCAGAGVACLAIAHASAPGKPT